MAVISIIINSILAIINVGVIIRGIRILKELKKLKENSWQTYRLELPVIKPISYWYHFNIKKERCMTWFRQLSDYRKNYITK